MYKWGATMTIIRDGLAVIGAGFLLVHFSGGLVGLFSILKSKIPSLAPKIDMVQERVIGAKINNPSPVPTPTLLPNQPQPQPQQPAEQQAQWQFKLKTPWSDLETKANVGARK